MASLPFFSTDSMAMASMTTSFSDVAMEASTSDLVDYSRNPPNSTIFPSTKSTSDIYLDSNPNLKSYSSANPRLISLALPLTYEEMATTVNSNHVRCPKWSRSEFEMVMPDFHGAPKASPRKGHQWEAAAMAMPNDHNKRNVIIIIIMPPHHNDLFLLHHHDHQGEGEVEAEAAVAVEVEVENMETMATTISTPERNPSLLSRNRVWPNKVMCFTM